MSESHRSARSCGLLCSRVCHDLISPVGAIVNGLEVLEEEKDEATKEFALDLIKKSAGTASAKLQFCRIAFGAAGSAGAQIDLGDAETISRGFFEDEKTKSSWNLPRALSPKNRVKLLLNILVIAGQAIPRGGKIDRRSDRDGRQHGIQSKRVGDQCQSSASGAAFAHGRGRGRPRRPSHTAFLCGPVGQGLWCQSHCDDGWRNSRHQRAIERAKAQPARLTTG